MRAFLAGEDEVVIAVLEPLDHALAGEEIVGEIHRAQRLQARPVLFMPAFDGVSLAILLLGAILFGDELRRQRNDLGMSRRDHGRRQKGMITLDLAIGAFARQAMRAGDLVAAEIFAPVEGDEGSVAEPAEGFAHRGLEQQPFRVLEAGREPRRGRIVEHVADVVVRRDLLDAEQGLAVRAPVAFLQPALERKEGRALHEEHRKGRHTEIGHGDVSAPTLARVRKSGANGPQARQQRRQNLHP